MIIDSGSRRCLPTERMRKADLFVGVSVIALRWVARASAASLFLAATPLSAQQPGDTVRVSGELVGVVVEADSAGLLLSAGYASYAGMQSLELWGGRGTQAKRGFVYGFIAGGIAGTVWGAGMTGELGRGLAAGGLTGLFTGWIGSLIGSTIKTEIWEPVPVPGGISLRLAVGGR